MQKNLPHFEFNSGDPSTLCLIYCHVLQESNKLRKLYFKKQIILYKNKFSENNKVLKSPGKQVFPLETINRKTRKNCLDDGIVLTETSLVPIYNTHPLAFLLTSSIHSSTSSPLKFLD